MRPGDEAVIPHPSFVVYPMIVQAVGGIRVVVTLKDYRLDLEAMARAITPMTKLVFIANPNNPTATIVTGDEVEDFMARVPDRVIVVFDEAYFEFAQGPDFPDSLALHAAGPEGRRAPHLLQGGEPRRPPGRVRGGRSRRVAPDEPHPAPFNVNSLAQVAALAALEDEAHIVECLRMIEAGRAYLDDEFASLGLRFPPSRANFILVDVGRNALDVYQRLLREGVIVRPMTRLRHGDRAPDHHRHAGGEPPAREGAPQGAREAEARVIRRLASSGRDCSAGSVAQAARARRLAGEIVGGRAATRASVAPALRDGGGRPRDHRSGRAASAGADFCVLATPVADPRGPARTRSGAAADAGAVITDVGSTKGASSRRPSGSAAARPLDFVGSHPMAGSEQSGFAEARADLFRGATVILTPTERTAPAALKRVRGFWEALGARVTLARPRHPRPRRGRGEPPAASGRATPSWTRCCAWIPASSTWPRAASATPPGSPPPSPPMWREIFQDNRDALAEAVAAFRQVASIT